VAAYVLALVLWKDEDRSKAVAAGDVVANPECVRVLAHAVEVVR
jgi:hypothetical protein